MLVSIIIINFNYGKYLNDSINSCINQTYPNVEVIVVDDGSTDNSRFLIDEYGDSVKKIYQENSGMITASNNGFEKSKGEIIIFLDADDYLYKDSVAKIVKEWEDGISSLFYRVRQINSKGEEIGFIPPLNSKISNGDVRSEILETGTCNTPPTSGNAFSRDALNQIFPIKDAVINDSGTYYDVIPTDSYLKLRTPFFGPVVSIEEPLAAKRIHGSNNKGKSPYVNDLKRHRHLKLARLNADFIKEQLNGKEEWDEDILFHKNKLVRIRMISLRFDGDIHPWPNDTRLGLIKIFFKTRTKSDWWLFHKQLYYLTILFLIAYLPKNFTIKILKINAIKSGRKI
ncbi:MAG: glycosyltransferase family 2 protein [Bacteroidia bacterium]|nr:glycosyltransferase family 2 protein [Bacteroidia bacterium]